MRENRAPPQHSSSLSKKKMADPYIQLGDQLKQIREETGLNKSELARLLNVDRRQIDYMEAGTRRIDFVECCHLSQIYAERGFPPSIFFGRLLWVTY